MEALSRKYMCRTNLTSSLNSNKNCLYRFLKNMDGWFRENFHICGMQRDIGWTCSKSCKVVKFGPFSSSVHASGTLCLVKCKTVDDVQLQFQTASGANLVQNTFFKKSSSSAVWHQGFRSLDTKILFVGKKNYVKSEGIKS